ncbi:MAG: hypothetical protein Q4C70_09620, partial [Planctomycetia bacterium]|nr:hypothetical protein [Planctomycetia bacterium]
PNLVKYGTKPTYQTTLEVLVEDIRFLKQSDTELRNPEIRLGTTSAIRLRGTVKTGEQILFDANDSAANLVTVYDGNWNFLRTLPVEIMGTFQVPQNQPVHVSVGSEDHASDGCWFEIRLTTTGSPILVPKNPKP